ncbi:MAG TPA: cell division protein FtsZ, partial [archaeon]|nr:cell division protein FtsZ [archaeon]
MESIIREAISRAEQEGRNSLAKPKLTFGETDEELEEVLKLLKTNIRVFGCGGGGSNTIARMTQEGITGA